MEMMKRILIAAHPTAGHTNALRAIGARLLGQGHKVAMAIVVVRLPFADRYPEPIRGAVTLPESIARDGIEILPLNISPLSLWYALQLPRAKGQTELGLALKVFTTGMEQQARHIAEHTQKWKADVVVGDYLMPAAMLAAKLAGRPYAALYHSALPFPVEEAPPFGSGLTGVSSGSQEWINAEEKFRDLVRFFDMRVHRTAKALGLDFEREALLTHPISDDLNLLATTPELEPGLFPLEGPVVMTGPCLPQVKNDDPNDPVLAVLRTGTIHVYVSLGTVFNGQPRVYEAILDGLSTMEAQVIVSAGASLDQLAQRANSKTHLFRRVPQVALLSRVDIVVTHGGNNTVQETLAAGKPMVVVPFGGDQIVNAQRVERLGVGIAIPAAGLNAESIRRAIKTALQSAMVERARALGNLLQQYDGTEIAAGRILELASGAAALPANASA